MALLPDDRAGQMSPAEIILRCKRLTDHILRHRAYAAEKPSYGTVATIQKLKKQRRQLQGMIRPRLAAVDGEAVA